MVRATKLNYVTCDFGVKGSWAAGYHPGIDFRAAVGTDIFATKGGRVVHSGYGGRYGSAYGNYVVIQSWHKGIPVQHLYAHLQTAKVTRGSKVLPGQLIGLSGETGRTFGAHLHYEERVFPFGYYNHRKPQLLAWHPANKKWWKRIIKKIEASK